MDLHFMVTLLLFPLLVLSGAEMNGDSESQKELRNEASEEGLGSGLIPYLLSENRGSNSTLLGGPSDPDNPHYEDTGSNNTAPANPSGEDTGSNNTAPANPSGEDTGSNNTAPGSSSGEDTGSNDTAPANPSGEDTGSNNTAPGSSSGEDTGSNDTAPGSSSGEDTGSNNTTPENPSREDTGSNNTTPGNPSGEDTGSNNTTPGNPSGEDTGSNNTIPGNPSGEDTGSNNTTPGNPSGEDTGYNNTAAGNPNGDDTGFNNTETGNNTGVTAAKPPHFLDTTTASTPSSSDSPSTGPSGNVLDTNNSLVRSEDNQGMGSMGDMSRIVNKKAWAAIFGTAIVVGCVVLVLFMLLKRRNRQDFMHRKLEEDFNVEPVLRLDNFEPLKMGHMAYDNPGLQGDSIQMDNIQTRGKQQQY